MSLPGNLTDIGLGQALGPYRKKYRRIHFASPVVQAVRRFEDPATQAEFERVSVGGCWWGFERVSRSQRT